jgi:hypothetical protein
MQSQSFAPLVATNHYHKLLSKTQNEHNFEEHISVAQGIFYFPIRSYNPEYV